MYPEKFTRDTCCCIVFTTFRRHGHTARSTGHFGGDLDSQSLHWYRNN